MRLEEGPKIVVEKSRNAIETTEYLNRPRIEIRNLPDPSLDNSVNCIRAGILGVIPVTIHAWILL
jgi:hypothetical protein